MTTFRFTAKKFFIVKTSEIPDKICGNSQQSYFITKNSGFTLKKVCHSNTHLTLGNGIGKIHNVYELEEIKLDYVALNSLLPFTSNITDHSNTDPKTYTEQIQSYDSPATLHSYITTKQNHLHLIDLQRMQEALGYGDKQLENIIEHFKLVKIYDNLYIRITYENIVKILCVYQSLVKTNSDLKELCNFWPEYICTWVKNTFRGESTEIVYYIMLDCHDNIVQCRTKIKENVLERIDKESLRNFIMQNQSDAKFYLLFLEKLWP